MRSANHASATELVTAATRRIHASTATGLVHRWEAALDADELLRIARGGIPVLDGNAPVEAPRRRRFEALVERRVGGEPMAQIRGHVDFRALRIPVRRGVFAPRLSSELLVDAAVRRLRRRRAPVAVDVATGVGPVALAVANEVPTAQVHGCDISQAAIAAANASRRRLRLRNLAFHRGDLLDALPHRLQGSVDLISVHPPYVPRGELHLLPREVSRFEPRTTLTDGSIDGLGMVRRLVDEAPLWLRPGGWLLVEVSPDHSRSVARVLRGGLAEVGVQGGRGEVTRIVAGRHR